MCLAGRLGRVFCCVGGSTERSGSRPRTPAPTGAVALGSTSPRRGRVSGRDPPRHFLLTHNLHYAYKPFSVSAGMADLTYEDLEFEPLPDKVRIRLFRTYWFDVANADFDRAEAAVRGPHTIALADKKAKRFEFLLAEGFSRLRGPFGKPTVYIHAGLGVPLVGTNEFGIVDRDT